MTHDPIIPGATIGILGAGQLGKMSLVAAHQLGYHTLVWSAPGDIPAMEMATHRVVAPYDDTEALETVLRTADVITTEWENIPLSLIEELERRGAIVRPGSNVLKVAQSRQREKRTADNLGIPITPTAALMTNDTAAKTLHTYLPGILKTDALGYDGKGQWSVTTMADLKEAISEAGKDGPRACVLEKRVELQTEISVLVARTSESHMSVSDVVENRHKDGILDTTVYPVGVHAATAISKVREYSRRIADHLELEGVLALEFFVGADGNVLFNEMAPRPHNSFHGSIEAAYTSQFEQHVRAICGLNLGNVQFHSPFTMKNLIGGSWKKDWSPAFDGWQRLHLYGKAESRPGRKMGHVTTLGR